MTISLGGSGWVRTLEVKNFLSLSVIDFETIVFDRPAQ